MWASTVMGMLVTGCSWIGAWDVFDVSVGSVNVSVDWLSCVVFFVVVDGSWYLFILFVLNGLVVWEFLVVVNSLLNLLNFSVGVRVNIIG